MIGIVHITADNIWHLVHRTGPNKWRDTQKPKEILEEYCKKNNISGPFYYGATKVTVDGKMYNLADFGKYVCEKKLTTK